MSNNQAYNPYAAPETRQPPPLRTVDPARVATPTHAAPSSRIIGLFAILFGVPLWLEAARFTRDGWILFINWLCARFSIPWQVPTLHWLVALAALVIIGVCYSHVELIKQPVKPPRNWRKEFFVWPKWRFERRWEAWIVWIVLVASDIGTTYAGAQTTDTGGIALMRDIAASGGRLAIYAILITFLPDRLIRFGWRALKG
jgi:hypothetical protein